MARKGTGYYLLVAVLVAWVAGGAAQGLPSTLSGVECFGDSDNQAAAEAIAKNCGNLGAGASVDSNGNLNIDCPANCGKAFNMLTASCRNELASGDIGDAYKAIFNSCDVSYTASGSGSGSGSGGNSTTPTAATPSATPATDTTAFDCLASTQNRAAGEAFVRDCSGLTPEPDSAAAGGISINCPADCSSALKMISQDCRNSIANDAAVGGSYQLIFNACGVSFSGSGSNSTTTPPSAGSPSPSAGNASSPAASPEASAPEAGTPSTGGSSASVPTAAPVRSSIPVEAPATSSTPTTSSPVISSIPVEAPASSSTPTATPTQAAHRTGSSLAPAAAAAALCMLALAA